MAAGKRLPATPTSCLNNRSRLPLQAICEPAALTGQSSQKWSKNHFSGNRCELKGSANAARGIIGREPRPSRSVP